MFGLALVLADQGQVNRSDLYRLKARRLLSQSSDTIYPPLQSCPLPTHLLYTPREPPDRASICSSQRSCGGLP